MRKLIETRFQGYQSLLEQPDHRPLDVVARLRDEYQKLHDQPIHDPGVQEARYREIEASEPRQALKGAMNEWCAVWFWPTDEESFRHVPTPETFHAKSSEARSSIIRHLATDLSSSTGNWSSPTCSHPIGAGSTLSLVIHPGT